jgi:hypothetical protein
VIFSLPGHINFRSLKTLRKQYDTMAAEAASVYPSLENRPLKGTVCLFDVDGTLTPARQVCSLSSASFNQLPENIV